MQTYYWLWFYFSDMFSTTLGCLYIHVLDIRESGIQKWTNIWYCLFALHPVEMNCNQSSIAYSLSLSFKHHPDMTEILLKTSSIHLLNWTKGRNSVNTHSSILWKSLSIVTERSEQTVQTKRSSLIRIYIVCHSICIFWMHYCNFKTKLFHLACLDQKILRTTPGIAIGVGVHTYVKSLHI